MGERGSATRFAAFMLGCAAFAAPFLTSASARADDAAEDAASKSEPANVPAELAPIVVDADRQTDAPLVERSFETPEDVSGFGETIFAEPTWRSFESPAELLGQSVGAQIRRQGGRDDFSTLSIRGAPAGQVRVFLDGVALGRATDSVVNLADLPFDMVERIEIYRGFSPVALSPASAAGVVNIITRDPKVATASVAVGGGSYGSAKVNAGGAGPVAGGSASAFASYRHTDGDFDYVDDNGTVNNPFDDPVRKRTNNDSDAVDSLLRWRRDVLDKAKLQLRNHIFYKEEGVPGRTRRSDPTARLETVRDIAAVALGQADGRWSIDESVTWQRKKLSKTKSGAYDNTADTTASSTTGRWGTPLGKSNWFSGSGDYTWEGFDQGGTLALGEVDAGRHSIAIAAGDDFTIDALATTLIMQLRHQQLWSSSNLGADGNEHSTDPRLGVRWQPAGGLAIKANAASYFRPPNFDELYGTDGFTTGNPALRPETGIAFDAGFEWTVEREPLGKLALGYSWFGSEVDDIILVRLWVDGTSMARNVTKARIRGHEARVEWHGPAGFALSANYTFQEAENRSSALGGKDLEGLPPHEAWARLSWTHGMFVVAYDIDIASSHYTDSENFRPKLPTRTVHGFSVVIGPFWKGVRLAVEADNLGDSLVPDETGFPLPGRAYYATLSWSAASIREKDGTR